jgi:hypothetical protein
LDVCPVRQEDGIFADAAELGIIRIFIPSGMADELQPPNRFVFVVLKSRASRVFQALVEETILIRLIADE